MNWFAPHDRSREKLEHLGPSVLGDNELLAMLVGHGFRSASAIDLSNQILASVRGLHGLTRQSLADLRRFKGLGIAKASKILAAIELRRRTLSQNPGRPVRLGSPAKWRRIFCRAMVRIRSSDFASCCLMRSTAC